jgi:hypothetical protein
MTLESLFALIETLRKTSIGEPEWIEDKRVFEYREQTAKVVAVLKLVRAAHGLSAINILCRFGLFIDAGAIMRCVFDCTDEVYFLLEDYPKASGHVEQFARAFFESTIDGHLEGETPSVPIKKIRSAVVRVLKGRHDDETQKRMERIYVTFCGYIHANYAHIMEVYNGSAHDFNLAGVPSEKQRAEKSQYVEVAAESVRLAAAFLAQKLELSELVGQLNAL